MASTDRLRLTIRLNGPLVDQHRLPLSEFSRVSRQFHAALRDVAIVLSGYGPSGRAGRAKKFIEEATDLDVVVPAKRGSFVLELEVPTERAIDQQGLPLAIKSDLTEQAVHSLISGLSVLDENAEALPHGFDRGVLKAITPFSTSFKKGVTDITFTVLHGSRGKKQACLDAEGVRIVDRLIKRPVLAEAAAQGTLEMVDFKTLECRIDRPPLPGVVCFFDEKERDTVQGALRQFVHVEGQGQFDPNEIEPRKIWVSSLKILYEALPFDPQLFWREPTLKKLATAKATTPFRLSADVTEDPWRDDDEAARLIAAIKDDY